MPPGNVSLLNQQDSGGGGAAPLFTTRPQPVAPAVGGSTPTLDPGNQQNIQQYLKLIQAIGEARAASQARNQGVGGTPGGSLLSGKGAMPTAGAAGTDIQAA